jgi:hypothetical protein
MTRLVIYIGFLMWLTIQPLYATTGKEAKSALPQPQKYPSVYARNISFNGALCVPTQSRRAGYEEVFILDRSQLSKEGVSDRSVRVKEFFSNRSYSTKFKPKRPLQGSLLSPLGAIELDCRAGNKKTGLGPNHAIADAGNYLSLVNVDSFGQYGEKIPIDNCEVGSHCDLGTQGLALKTPNGSEVWAVLLAIRNPGKFGHPTYRLPKLNHITTDVFNDALILNDNSILLSYDELKIIRLSLESGAFHGSDKNISVIPLRDWTQLKAIFYRRYFDSASQCFDKKIAKCDWQDRSELYFYTLQDFLFPQFSSKSKKTR